MTHARALRIVAILVVPLIALLCRRSGTRPRRTPLPRLPEGVRAGDGVATRRFLRLIWTTDFAARKHADVLDRQPLHLFPRDEGVFAAVNESYERVLDGVVEDQLRQPRAPVPVVHGAHDTEPARARQVAELASRACQKRAMGRA